MIYLNNAATSYPKPAGVLAAISNCLAAPPAGQFRGSAGHESGDALNSCRRNIARLLGVSASEHIFFTSGATQAANAVIHGILWKKRTAVVTSTEHNSVLRPLHNSVDPLQIRIAHCDADGYVDPERICGTAPNGCDAVFVNHCSNVTGAVQDLRAIGATAREMGALFVVDASQSAGCMPVEADACGADIVIFTGHKSLLGPQGTGGFFARRPECLRPLLFGGTGRDSEKLIYRLDGDQEFEPGTQNIAGICGLDAAAYDILELGLDTIQHAEEQLCAYAVARLREIGGVRLYVGRQQRRGPLVSFVVDGLDPGDVAYMLSEIYGISVRAGLQCAPLIHRDLGTAPKGTVRASFSRYNTTGDVDALADAVREIAKSASAGVTL